MRNFRRRGNDAHLGLRPFSFPSSQSIRIQLFFLLPTSSESFVVFGSVSSFVSAFVGFLTSAEIFVGVSLSFSCYLLFLAGIFGAFWRFLLVLGAC